MKINKKYLKILRDPFKFINKKYVCTSSFVLEIILVIIIVAENASLFAQINSKLLPLVILNALFLIYLKF